MSGIWGYWLVTALALLGIFVGLGVWITKRPLGILIDKRNKMSLSRFQIVLWTWLIVSAFFAIGLKYWSMDIEVGAEIWALMGISLGSAAGAVMVKEVKANKKIDENKMSDATAGRIKSLSSIAGNRMGVLDANAEPKHATLADLFKGEEVTDHGYLDISKVQMFVLTLAVWLGYAFALWSSRLTCPPPTEPGTASAIACFPQLSQQLLILLSISHAGYLTVKATPKTPTV